MELDQAYWHSRWVESNTPWDMGNACPALTNYLNQLTDKGLRILIPGAGGAHEAVWLWENGFRNFVVLDWSEKAFEGLLSKLPQLAEKHIAVADFFEYEGEFDVVMEQTFFCALPPAKREAYVEKMHELIVAGGTLAGLLFDIPLDQGPPFGGDIERYHGLFSKHFESKTMEACYNSIQPREGRELFFILKKPIL